MKSWYNLSAVEVVQGLNSHIKKGLTKENVEKNKELYGDNVISIINPKSLFKIVLEEILNPWSISTILLIMLSVYSNSWSIMSFSMIFYLFILISLIYYRRKSENKFSAVESLNSHKVQVVRNGIYDDLDIDELVVGDIVIVNKKMYVPADLRIIQCENMKVNELAVTGKNYICEKFSARISERDINIEEASNMLFKSSVVVEGEGVGVVVAVGMDTEVGSLIKAENKIENSKDLFKLIKGTLNRTSIIAILIATCICISGIVMNKNIYDIVRIVKQIIFCIMPLVAVVEALIFIIVFLKFAKKKRIYINNISVLEKLKNIQSIFMEKHGVLTEDEYKISSISIDNMNLTFKQGNYFNIEKFYGHRKVKENIIREENCHTLKRFMETAFLCNNAVHKAENNEYRGDKKEIAVLKFIEKVWTDCQERSRTDNRVLEVPMDGDTMIRTSINNIDRRFRANVMGPFDNVLERCTHILRNDVEVELKGDELNRVREMAYDIATSGAEVMAIAYRNFNYRPSLKENILSNLVLVGLAGCESTIKDDAYKLSSFAVNTGMDVIVFAEENKLSNKFFGRHIGFLQEYNNVYSGVELKFMTDYEVKNVENHEVMFSNLEEEQKINIMKEHKKNRGITAAISSKLTSVPHLCEADVSISHGKDVSGIVRKLSDIYIEDVSISSLANIIEESSNLLYVYKTIINHGLFIAIIMTITTIMTSFIENRVAFSEMWLILLTVMATSISGIITILRSKKYVFKDENGLDKNITGKVCYGEKPFVKKAIIWGFVIYGVQFLIKKYMEKHGLNYILFGENLSVSIQPIIILVTIILTGVLFKGRSN